MTFLFPHFSFSEKFKRNGLFILVKSLGTLSYPPHRHGPGPALASVGAGAEATGAGEAGQAGMMVRVVDQNNIMLHHREQNIKSSIYIFTMKLNTM